MPDNFTFDSSKHLYTMRQRLIPSVTNVLRVVGISRDLSMVRPDVLRAKRQLGTALHKCLHLLQTRDLDYDSVDVQLLPYLKAYGLFVKENGFKVEYVELRRPAEVNGMWYAGTLDVTGLIHGQPFVVDFKTTESSPDYGWAIQLAGYDMMVKPPMIPPFHYRRLTLQLLANGKYRQKEWKDSGDYDEWKWALALAWRRVNRGESIWEDQK